MNTVQSYCDDFFSLKWTHVSNALLNIGAVRSSDPVLSFQRKSGDIVERTKNNCPKSHKCKRGGKWNLLALQEEMWRRNIWERTAAALFAHKSADKLKKFCQKSKVNFFFLCQWSVLRVREHPHMYQHPQYYTAALHRSWEHETHFKQTAEFLRRTFFFFLDVWSVSMFWCVVDTLGFTAPRGRPRGFVKAYGEYFILQEL